MKNRWTGNDTTMIDFNLRDFVDIETRLPLGNMTNKEVESCKWNFTNASGNTIRQKYPSLQAEIDNLTLLVDETTDGKGCNWILGGPELVCLFEMCGDKFEPTTKEENKKLYGVEETGVLNDRWRIYKDALFPTNTLFMGYCEGNKLYTEPEYCAKIRVLDFI